MKREIVNSLGLFLRNMRELVDDLDDAQMVRQPAGVPNHPAWTIGHIIYSLQAICGELGGESTLPDDWEARFAYGSTPSADAGAYSPKAELLELLGESERRLRAQVAPLDDEKLSAPLRDEQHNDLFPTMGHVLLHVLVGHTASHVGQLAVWRRAMGLPPATVII